MNQNHTTNRTVYLRLKDVAEEADRLLRGESYGFTRLKSAVKSLKQARTRRARKESGK